MPRRVLNHAAGMFVILVIVGMCGRAARADDLKYAIQTAELLHTFSLGGAQIVRADLGHGVALLNLEKPDSSIIVAVALSGEKLFRKCVPSPGHPVLSGAVTGDGSTFILSEDMGDYHWRKYATNNEGHELCSFPIDAGVQASPGGKFFCPVPNSATDPVFEVFDRRGTRIDVDAPFVVGWTAMFLSDSLVVLAGLDRARFIHLPSGETRDSVDLPFGTDNWWDHPLIAKAASGSSVAVYDRLQVRLYSPSGIGLSHLSADGSIGDVFLSEKGDWFGIKIRNLRDSSGFIYVGRQWGYRAVCALREHIVLRTGRNM